MAIYGHQVTLVSGFSHIDSSSKNTYMLIYFVVSRWSEEKWCQDFVLKLKHVSCSSTGESANLIKGQRSLAAQLKTGTRTQETTDVRQMLYIRLQSNIGDCDFNASLSTITSNRLLRPSAKSCLCSGLLWLSKCRGRCGERGLITRENSWMKWSSGDDVNRWHLWKCQWVFTGGNNGRWRTVISAGLLLVCLQSLRWRLQRISVPFWFGFFLGGGSHISNEMLTQRWHGKQTSSSPRWH